MVAASHVANMSSVRADMFNDDEYSFMHIGGAKRISEDSEKVVRQFSTRSLHAGMAAMAAGENIQLGFDVNLASRNPWLKDIGLSVLDAIAEFDATAEYLAQNFVYFGNTQQANLHNDPLPGFSLQLANAKLWRFVNPAHTPLVSPFRGDNPGVFYCDLGFLENSTVPYVEVLVEPGDMIYFPEHWWHEVHPIEADGFGITVAFRTIDPASLLGPAVFLDAPMPVLYHKVAAFSDMAYNARPPDAPERQDEEAGTKVTQDL